MFSNSAAPVAGCFDSFPIQSEQHVCDDLIQRVSARRSFQHLSSGSARGIVELRSSWTYNLAGRNIWFWTDDGKASMGTSFDNSYEDPVRAGAYAELEFPGTYYLAFVI